jgi:hypothetical protein
MKAIAILLLAAASPALAQLPQERTEGAPPPNSPASPTSPGAVIQGPAAKDAAKGVTRVTFESLDRDRDGFISRREAEAHAELAQAFDRLDADRDGRLTPGEFAVFEKK